MKSDYPRLMRKRDFLICVENTYGDKNTDYLLSLIGALYIIVSNRIGYFKSASFKYEGYVKL